MRPLQEQDTRELEQVAERDLEDRPGHSASSTEHLFRLFVGWVPKLFSETELRPLFDQVGWPRPPGRGA
jgi:hypothetical protein